MATPMLTKRMPRFVGKPATWGLVCLFAIILANGALSYRYLTRLVDAFRRADAARQRLAGLDYTMSQVRNAEVAARGYAITGDDRFLESFRASIAILSQGLTDLVELQQPTPAQGPAIERLRRQVAGRLRQLDDDLRLRSDRGQAAAAPPLSELYERRARNAIDATVAELKRNDQQAFDFWSAESDSNYEGAWITTISATAGAIILVGTVYLLTRRESLQRRQSERMLRLGEARFRRLVDANVMGVLFANSEGRVSEANDAFLKMVGYSREELQAQAVDWRKMTPPEFAAEDERAAEELRTLGASAPYEKQFVRKDGTRVPCLMGCAQLDEPPGTSICYAIDLSERNRSQETIERLNRDLEHRVHELETLLDVLPVGIALASDPQCRSITTNEAFAQMLGIPRRGNASAGAAADDISFKVKMLRNGREAQPDEMPLQRAAATGVAVVNEEYEVCQGDGSAVKLLVSVAPLFDRFRQARGCIGAFVDITQRKHLEERLHAHADQLHNQQLWLEALLNLLPVPLVLIEPGAARISFANHMAHEMAGGAFPLGESAELYDNAYYHFTNAEGERLPPDQMPSVRVARGESLNGVEVNWRLPSGERTIMITADTLPSLHGHAAIGVLLFQDISQLKQIETELRRNNQSKDAFLAMLGHELRNPLAAINGSAELIAIGHPDDPNYRSALDILQRHIQHLTRLVDDMLDLARLTTGRIKLRLEELDLTQPLTHAIQTAKALIEGRGHELRVEIPPEPAPLRADRARLEQVFTNLLINAAKFTPPGGRISVLASIEDAQAVVRIRDSGVGIDPRVIPALFDLFSQVPSTIDRAEGGLGIGLSVVHNLVALHGGSVSAESEGIGRGSQFEVRLPIYREHYVPHKSAGDSSTELVSPRELRVLLVEDQEDIARVMQALIQRCGHQARWAPEANRALEIACEWRPQVALLDIGLPGMDGYDLARAIRDNEDLRDVVLVALTGYGQEDDRLRSRAAGMDQHLLKPVTLQILEGVLRQCAGLFARRSAQIPPH